MSRQRLYFNGIDPAGRYVTPPMSPEELVRQVLPELELPQALPSRHVRRVEAPDDLAATGWAVVFAPGLDPRVRHALERLLDLRRAQASRHSDHLYREIEYRPEETARDFLARQGVRPGEADPKRLPYHILLVGDFDALPFPVQRELSVSHAVGRICFDRVDGYAAYARSVVEAETRPPARPREVVLFGPDHAGDPVARASRRELLEPLAEAFFSSGRDWKVRRETGDAAVKAALARALGSGETPALLFAACHGLVVPEEDGRREDLEGALICQDWPGPAAGRGVDEDHCFAAADVPDGADLQGLIAFFVARDSVGAAPKNGFHRSLAARLPQRLLSHPRGGALAVVGYVNQPGVPGEATLPVFGGTLQRLLRGFTVGWATESIHQSYARVAEQLAEIRDQQGGGYHPEWISTLWGLRNSFGNLSIFGDPAVRIPGSAGTDVQLRLRSTRDESALALDGDIRRGPGSTTRGRIGPREPEEIGATRGSGSLGIPPPKGRPKPKPQEGGSHFSSYTPAEIAPEVWNTLLVYCFKEGAAQAVEEDSARRLGSRSGHYAESRISVVRPIAAGSEIQIIPELAGCRFNPPQASVLWLEDWHGTEFRFQALQGWPGFTLDTDLPGRLSFYERSVLVADIAFSVRLTLSPRSAPDPAGVRRTEVRPYQSVFISYSRSDVAVVETLERAYAALGVSSLRDIRFLRPGEEWQPKLLEKIEESDIFQLFWSESARKSKWVKAEWRHALGLQRPCFIRPVFWEDPMPKAPKELAGLTFHQLRLER